MQTLISKIGMALTAFVTLMVLGSYGYDEMEVKDLTAETINSDAFQQVIKGNWMATTLLCGLSMAACAIPLFFYTFTEKRQVEAVSRVMARKKAAGTMNEAEAGEFVAQLKLVDPKTQERTYKEVADILGWENADKVREFIAEADAIAKENAEEEALWVGAAQEPKAENDNAVQEEQVTVEEVAEDKEDKE
ncbi:MAG: hypothetical protein K2K24_03835, partial [Clostridia bacterium]|nr:hypothetical protein [Clostridia bacterium]